MARKRRLKWVGLWKPQSSAMAWIGRAFRRGLARSRRQRSRRRWPIQAAGDELAAVFGRSTALGVVDPWRCRAAPSLASSGAWRRRGRRCGRTSGPGRWRHPAAAMGRRPRPGRVGRPLPSAAPGSLESGAAGPPQCGHGSARHGEIRDRGGVRAPAPGPPASSPGRPCTAMRPPARAAHPPVRSGTRRTPRGSVTASRTPHAHPAVAAHSSHGPRSDHAHPWSEHGIRPGPPHRPANAQVSDQVRVRFRTGA